MYDADWNTCWRQGHTFQSASFTARCLTHLFIAHRSQGLWATVLRNMAWNSIYLAGVFTAEKVKETLPLPFLLCSSALLFYSALVFSPLSTPSPLRSLHG